MNILQNAVMFCILAALSMIMVHSSAVDDTTNMDTDCCEESMFAFQDDDEIAKNCSAKFGINLKYNSSNEIDMEKFACFMDCVFTGSKLLVDGIINMDNVKADIAGLAENNTDLGNVMVESMEICSALAKRMVSILQNSSAPSEPTFREKCSPVAQIVSDCAAMEYYIKCPDKYWTPTEDCEAAKFYAFKHRYTSI